MWCARVGRWGGSGSVWVVEREERERYWEAESKRGGFSADWKRLCVSSRWTIVCWVLGSGCWELSLCPGWPILYPILHLSVSLSLGLCYTLFCLLLFCASLCISLFLTFSHTKQRDIFPFWREGIIFLCTGCFVLSEEHVGKLVVTGEECWVELFQPVRWLSLPKDWM